MASRNYAMAYDTPYNQRLLQVLRDYNMQSDTNGQPDIFNNDRLSGGSFTEMHTLPYHPHLPHFSRMAFPPSVPIGRTRGFVPPDMSGGLRPSGMVDPFVRALPPHFVQNGNQPSYPMYNAVELRAVGGSCCGCQMDGGKFGIGLVKDIGKDVAKGVVKEGAKEASKALVKSAMSGAMSGEGKRPRGRPRKQSQKSREDEKLAMEVKGLKDAEGGKFNFGKAMKKMGKSLKPVGKYALPIVEDVAKIALKEGAKEGTKALIKSYMSGSGSGDGRKRRAEIVKKVMAEKGLKMVEASKYVKDHGLYKK